MISPDSWLANTTAINGNPGIDYIVRWASKATNWWMSYQQLAINHSSLCVYIYTHLSLLIWSYLYIYIDLYIYINLHLSTVFFSIAILIHQCVYTPFRQPRLEKRRQTRPLASQWTSWWRLMKDMGNTQWVSWKEIPICQSLSIFHCLVVSNMTFIVHFIYGMSSQPHWRTHNHIFQRGRSTTNQPYHFEQFGMLNPRRCYQLTNTPHCMNWFGENDNRSQR